MSKSLEPYLHAVAAQLEVPIPEEWEQGVLANLDLFFHHAAIMGAADASLGDPAEALVP